MWLNFRAGCFNNAQSEVTYYGFIIRVHISKHRIITSNKVVPLSVLLGVKIYVHLFSWKGTGNSQYRISLRKSAEDSRLSDCTSCVELAEEKCLILKKTCEANWIDVNRHLSAYLDQRIQKSSVHYVWTPDKTSI